MKIAWSKNRKGAADDGKREKAASLSPSHRPLRFHFPLSPTSVQQKEASEEEPPPRVSKLFLWKYSLLFLEMVGWEGSHQKSNERSLHSCLIPRSFSYFALPWYLALRHQSLAFRARLCSKNGKTKRLRRMQPVQLSDGKTRHTFILRRIHPNWQGCWYRRWWRCSTVVHTKWNPW